MNIFVSGSIAYDDIMNFPHLFKDYFHPEKLHQISVSFVVSDLAKHMGGIATNISYGLRNTVDYLENPKSQTLNSKQIKQNSKINIYPVGAVGRDGRELLDFFKKNDIDTTFIQKDEKLYTATGKVITDKNNNQIWGFYYGASQLNPKFQTLSTKQIKLNSKSEKDFWILSATHEKPFAATLNHVIKNKLPYMFDPGMTLTWINEELLEKGVMKAKYVIGNDYEIAMIEKRLKIKVEDLVEKGISIITTLGSEGVKMNFAIDSVADFLPVSAPSKRESPRVSGIPLASRHLSQNKISEIFVPAVNLKKVVDPTGAGDAWRGGFVGALAAGRPLKECLIMGNVMASFAVESVGTVEYKVKKSEIHKRVKSISGK